MKHRWKIESALTSESNWIKICCRLCVLFLGLFLLANTSHNKRAFGKNRGINIRSLLVAEQKPWGPDRDFILEEVRKKTFNQPTNRHTDFFKPFYRSVHSVMGLRTAFSIKYVTEFGHQPFSFFCRSVYVSVEPSEGNGCQYRQVVYYSTLQSGWTSFVSHTFVIIIGLLAHRSGANV